MDSLKPRASSADLAFPLLAVLSTWALLQTACIWFSITPVLSGDLVDPDGYTHLLRVQHLVETGNWYDANSPRSNWPYGESMHWTRPVDMVILLGSLLLRPFLSFHDALFWFGIVMAPLCQLLSAFVAGWMAAPVLGRESRYAVMLLFLVQLDVASYMVAGRPDHHGMLFLSFILANGFALRAFTQQGNRWAAFGAGAATAFGLWISTEFLVPLMAFLACFGLLWLWQGERWNRVNRSFAIGLAAAVAAALPIERAPVGLFYAEHDRLSIVHLVLSLLVVAFWMLVPPASHRLSDKVIARAIAGSLGIAAMAAVMYAIYPKFFGGPMAAVDPMLSQIWFWGVAEWQPLMPTSLAGTGQFLIWLGPSSLGLAWAIRLLWRARHDEMAPNWVLATVSLVLFILMAIKGLRFAPYAEIASLIPLLCLIGAVRHYLSRRRAWWADPMRALAVVAIVVGLPLAGMLIIAGSSGAASADGSVTGRASGSASGSCRSADVAPALNALAQPGGRPHVVAANIDSGPEIMYRTPDDVLGTPMHHNAAGIIASYRMMTAPDDGAAKAIIDARDVDLILLCPTSTERAFFKSDGKENTFYNRLVAGRLPEWLQPLPLPAPASGQFLLFAVTRSPS